MNVVDALPLMMRYLHGKGDLSHDEKEILLFALYIENRTIKDGLVERAIVELDRVDTPVARSAPPPAQSGKESDEI
jgi:hypothetical protein